MATFCILDVAPGGAVWRAASFWFSSCMMPSLMALAASKKSFCQRGFPGHPLGGFVALVRRFSVHDLYEPCVSACSPLWSIVSLQVRMGTSWDGNLCKSVLGCILAVLCFHALIVYCMLWWSLGHCRATKVHAYKCPVCNMDICFWHFFRQLVLSLICVHVWYHQLDGPLDYSYRSDALVRLYFQDQTAVHQQLQPLRLWTGGDQSHHPRSWSPVLGHCAMKCFPDVNALSLFSTSQLLCQGLCHSHKLFIDN